MSILLLPKGENELKNVYKNIFTEGRCILIFSAYLTEWPTPDKLNNSCEEFRMIVGKDFDITRKAACHAVMRWLPRKFHDKFLVASKIEGFHPKAVFWKNLDGKYFSIVGSSNLSNAAFTTNHEANIVSNFLFGYTHHRVFYPASWWVYWSCTLPTVLDRRPRQRHHCHLPGPAYQSPGSVGDPNRLRTTDDHRSLRSMNSLMTGVQRAG